MENVYKSCHNVITCYLFSDSNRYLMTTNDRKSRQDSSVPDM